MSQDKTADTVEERDRDIDVARMQTKEAQEAVEEGNFLEAIEAASSIINFAARAADRDAPVASVVVRRAGSSQDQEVVVTPGDSETVEVHGKAEITIRGHRRYE